MKRQLTELEKQFVKEADTDNLFSPDLDVEQERVGRGESLYYLRRAKG